MVVLDSSDHEHTVENVSNDRVCAVHQLVTLGCGEEYDELADEFGAFEDDQLRPQASPCPVCKIKKPTTKLGLATAYSPSSVTNVSILISNAAGSELRNYGSTLTIPNDPNSITMTDNELCTVGTTGAPPSTAYITFVLTTAAGTETVGQYIPIEETCD